MDIAEQVKNAIPASEHNQNQVVGIVSRKSSFLIGAIMGWVYK
jgi:hypothetical protein